VRGVHGQAYLPPLCSGCEEHYALPRLRSITSNLTATSGYFEPERFCSVQPHHFSDRPAVVLVTTRLFPPPWSVEELDACWVVKDRDSQQIAYVYFENEPGRRLPAKLLSKDEARRIAANIAKLPELLSKR
jgi:hypothetical protein